MSDLRKYFEAVHTMQGKPEKSLYGFVLAHGRPYGFSTESFLGGEPGMCFKNAAHAVMFDHALTYVEGYAMVYGIPFHHAWAVGIDGIVQDFTLKGERGAKGIGEYFGVPFQTKYLRKVQVRTRHYGVLEMHNIRDLLFKDNIDEVLQKEGA